MKAVAMHGSPRTGGNMECQKCAFAQLIFVVS